MGPRFSGRLVPSQGKSVLGWIGRLAGRRTAVEKSRENPVVRAAVGEAAVIYDRIPLSDFIDEDRRSKLARELYLEIVGICNTTDPKTTCREQLVATMLWVASFQVLVIPPAPEEDVSGLRGEPGITGELRAHLVDICRRNDELRSEIHKQNRRSRLRFDLRSHPAQVLGGALAPGDAERDARGARGYSQRRLVRYLPACRLRAAGARLSLGARIATGARRGHRPRSRQRLCRLRRYRTFRRTGPAGRME